MKNIRAVLTERFSDAWKFIMRHRLPSAAASLALILAITAVTVFFAGGKNEPEQPVSSTAAEPEASSQVQPEEVYSETPSVSKAPSSSETVSRAPVKKPQNNVKEPAPPAVNKPSANGDYKYNTNTDIDNNVFLDALIYTGYNIKKHRSDGMMWKYALSASKPARGWLSKISYGGGNTGYETLNGNPDIKRFERGGLVCASYVTYVYFNYLPNVAGIDTSSLPRPERPTLADSWYKAAKQWISKGYSRQIGFTASKTAAGFINFKPKETIPIGSVIVFCDAKKMDSSGSHVAVYAGYKNGYNWIFHVGNKNGPEFCAVERMNFGHDPQWPLAVIATPHNIRMAACLEVSITDDAGAPVAGVPLVLKNRKSGGTVNLGATDGAGKLSREGLVYGDYTLSFTLPSGYTVTSGSRDISLTTVNNSLNRVEIVLTRKPPEPPVTSEPGSGADSSGSSSSGESSGSSDNSGSSSSSGSSEENSDISSSDISGDGKTVTE